MQWVIHLLFGRLAWTINRRITDEEVVTVAGYNWRTRGLRESVETALEEMRRHMIAHNQQVIRAHKAEMDQFQQKIMNQNHILSQLNEQITEKEAELDRLKATISEKRRRHNLAPVPTPPATGDA